MALGSNRKKNEGDVKQKKQKKERKMPKGALHFGEPDYFLANSQSLMDAAELLSAACEDTKISAKLKKMGMHVYLEFPYQDPHDENPPPTVDVLLRISNGKGSQRKPVSLYNKIADSTTRLTVGALLRRLGVALDKCAENHELDADKRAYLQTELMAHTYVAHIEALEERALVKKRRKEAQKKERYLDAGP